MKKIKLSALLIYAVILGFSACGGGGGGGSDDPQNPGGDKIISISVINGVTPPAYGETPVSVITANAQFSGTVSWSTSPTKYEANTVYTATIELTAKDGYTLDGVSDDFFEVSGASVVSNDSDSGIITAEFPATGSAPPAVVNIKAILGVDAPARDAIPVTTITETEQYTGTISWSGSPTKFAASTVYTATITLTAKSGYTFNGISANFFTLSGATTVTNSSNSGVITAVFPVTEATVFSEVTDGNRISITFATGTEFKMITTPDIPTTNKFPTGENDHGSENVPARFIMGETEVTYQLWKEVYNWATSVDRGAEKYTFANMGVKGNDGASDKTSQHPVTIVNWYSSIVWCNALTEYYNANNGSEADLLCVYKCSGSIIRDSSDSNETACDGVEQDLSAKGFRLPTHIEWEFVARYRGTDATNTVSGYSSPYYTRGNSASGATADYSNESATSAVAVYYSWNTAEVKSKVANALGLYDMSGNVHEWCYDWHPTYGVWRRFNCGGGYGNYSENIQIGETHFFASDYVSRDIGFRFCRNM